MASQPDVAREVGAPPRDVDVLCRDTSDATVEALCRAATIRPFIRNDLLVAQGEPLPLVIILDGFAAARRTDADGHQFTLVVSQKGEVVGLRSVSHPVPSMFDLIALSDGRAAILAGAAVRSIAEADPKVALRLLDLSTANISQLLQRLDEVRFDDARQRFATVLLAYEPLLTKPEPVISRTDLASLIGTSREMLGCVMRSLEASGVVRRRGRSIRIVDRAALRQAADWKGEGREHVQWLRSANEAGR